MRTRVYQQESAYDLGTAGTKTFDLDFSDPISEIALFFTATNGATYNRNNPIELNISKIEIVDGGTVLWDLSGKMALSYASTIKGRLSECYYSGAPSDGPYCTIPLRFGRHIWDMMYAFNPVAHHNPQLRVTFNEATVNAAGATGFVSDSLSLSIIVKLMEQATAPKGFFACREVDSYTSLASGETKISIPTDRLIRSLMLRVYESGTDFRSNVTNMKLSQDGGKFVSFDLPSQQFVTACIENFSPILVPGYGNPDNGGTFQTWIGIDLEHFISSHEPGHIATGGSSWPAQMVINHEDNDGTARNGYAVHYGVIGWLFHNLMVYPFGDLTDETMFLDAIHSQKLDLHLTNGNAGAEVVTAIDTLYKY